MTDSARPVVVLRRIHAGDQGTFGRLEAPGFSCYSGELPWRGNASGVSCIPAGRYLAVWSQSPRLGRKTYRLVNVPGRVGCLIHPANRMGDKALGYVAELAGCIALGEALGSIKGQAALLRSIPAVRRFEEAMAGNPFYLEVQDA